MTQTVKTVEARFAPHEWASLMLSCDAGGNSWGPPVLGPQQGPQPEGKLTPHVGKQRLLKSTLSKVLHKNSNEIARVRIGSTVQQITNTAKIFIGEHEHYSDGLVDSLLELPAFQTSYTAFLAATAAAPKSALPRGPHLEKGSCADPALEPHVASLNAVLSQLQAHYADTSIEPLRLDVRTSIQEQRSDLFWFVYDPGVPAVIAEAMLARLESEAAHVIRCNVPSTWTTDDLIAVLRQREHSLRKFARFLAGMVGSPITIVPLEERIDVAEVVRQHRAGRQHLEAELSRIVAESER